MQQRGFQQVGRFGDAVKPYHQLGAADREWLLRTKADRVGPAPIAVTAPSRCGGLLPDEIAMMPRRCNPKSMPGMSFSKSAEPIDLLECCSGARTTAASLGMINDHAKSQIPGMGYAVSSAAGNTLLTIWEWYWSCC